MATLPAIDELLEPISLDQAAGEDLRWTPEWDRIREARRADDALEAGTWKRKEQKSSDWRLVQELATSFLEKRSKDLQLSLWLTEANINLVGFAGLRDGLRFTRELMVRFWDRGLFPAMEDGPQDRSGPFEWMNDKLADSVLRIPITLPERGEGFNTFELRDARLVGSESSWRDSDGYVDDDKKKIFDKALADGRRSMDTFRSTVAGTKREIYENLAADVFGAQEEFKKLDLLIDEKFIDEKALEEQLKHVAPSLREFRAAMNEISDEVLHCLEEKRRQEPDSSSSPVTPGNAAQPDGPPGSFTIRVPIIGFNSSPQSTSGSNVSWQEAERLVRTGQIDAGLAEMIRLAAAETSGRSRFQRKFLLAEVCLASNRERLAKTILEELAEQIDKFQLEGWETSDVIGGVWSRLYQLYNAGSSSDKDRASKLYERLCRLDPWQALACAD